MIVKRGDKYCIVSKHTKRNLGCVKSKRTAVKRLQQIEFFKRRKP